MIYPRRRPPTDDLTTPVLFAGPTAKGADLDALARAQEMQASGADRRDILDQTGWFKDRDGWSFEVSSPEGPQFQRPELSAKQRSVPLSSVSRDPVVDAAYPGLGDIRVIGGGGSVLGPGDAAMYLPKSGRPAPYVAYDQRNAFSPRANYFMQHEKQHAVDDAEGRLIPSMQADQSLPWEQKRSEMRAINGAYRDVYMTPEQRRAVPPWDSEREALEKMHPQYAGKGSATPSLGAAVTGGAPVKGMYDPEMLRRLGLLADPAALSRAGTARGKGGLLETLDGMGPPRGGSGGNDGGRLEVLASASPQGGGLLDAAPRQPSEAMAGGDDRAIMQALSQAKSPVEAEAILKSIADASGDAGLEAVNRIAKQFGLRTPWHRDFSKPPSAMGGLLGPSGRPRPLQRDDAY